jgi:hypothetical protein
MAGCGCGCGAGSTSSNMGPDFGIPNEIGRFNMLTDDELQSADCAASLAYKSSIYYGDSLTNRSPFLGFYKRLFGDSSSITNSPEVSSLIPKPFSLTWRHTSNPERLSAVIGLHKEMSLQKKETEYSPKEVDSIMSSVACRITDGINLYSKINTKSQTGDLGVDLLFSPSLKVDVSKRISRGNLRNLDHFRFGLGIRRTGAESLFKLEFGESLKFGWEAMVYLPLFSNDGLFDALPFGWRRPLTNQEESDKLLENMPNLPFNSAAYLKYSFWYMGGGEKFSKIDKAALSFINSQGLKAELS